MFTINDFRTLLNTQPFVPFRLHLSDGSSVDVRSKEVALLTRYHAVIGLLDPDATDTIFDRWAIVWYMHITRVEMLRSGPPPLSPPPGPTESPAPASS